MLKNYLIRLICLLMFTGISSRVFAVSETEPNNNWNQAKNIPSGGNGTGSATYGGDVDWWRYTMTSDGNLNIQCTPNNSIWTYCIIYDTLGTIQLSASSYGISVFNVTVNGLKAGTYYIKVNSFYTTDSSNYTIIPTFTAAPVANDVEPNNTKATAQTLALNGSTTGHINYYYNNSRDSSDWFKIVTNVDGDLTVTLNVSFGMWAWIELFDNNGTTAVVTGQYTTSVVSITAYGLAKGTYFARVTTFYTYDYNAYTISNSLATTVPNDAEPNNTAAAAVTKNINDSLTGHIGYYYNLKRDTSDWYKVTTTAEGSLNINCYTLISAYLYVDILDSNGTTLLSSIYGIGSFTNTVNGLRAGTYYFRVYCYYNYQYTPYAIKITHTLAPYTNDVEPNNTKSQAITIAPNDSTTGHAGFYYNGYRDSSDWYKVTTSNDGWLRFILSTPLFVWVYLDFYDNNGTSLITQQYTSTSTTVHIPNLKKGTYYVRIRPYYDYDYVSYSLKSVFVSQLANDPEPNQYAKNGTVINGYTQKTGHIGYYGSNTYDNTDWWKIAYGGIGPIEITYTPGLHKYDNIYDWAYFKVYKDTNAAPLDNQLINFAYTKTLSAAGLTAGTYYIKIEQYGSSYTDYTLKANYRDTTSATIKLTSSNVGTAGLCNTGAATYFVTRGLPPYSVQLYLDGIAYGAPVSTSDTAKFTALPPGAYYATVKSSGAVTNVTTSTIKGIVPKPKGQNAVSITGTGAVIKWTAFNCVDGFIVSYKKTSDPTFTSDTLGAGLTKDTLINLSLSTSYDYKVAAYTIYNGTKYISAYTTLKSFTTLAARSVDIVDGAENNYAIIVMPNPAIDYISFQLPVTNQNMVIRITNALGQTVYSTSVDNVTDINQSIDISALKPGVYMLTVTRNGLQQFARFVKE